jgi:hypothetical protein
LDHYTRVPWANAPLGSEVDANVDRSRLSGDAEAAGGPVIVAQRTADAVAELRHSLPTEPLDRVLYVAWRGWSLTLEDFLITRMLEIVIHIDDLAAHQSRG